MKQPASPYISVIIPVRAIGAYSTVESFPAFEKQTYKNFEVIILPNLPSPEDHKLTKKYSWLRIIATNHITRPAQKRNIGAKKAKGHIIAFIDDDAYPSTKWLETAAHLFDSMQIESVCGPGVLPKNTNMWEKIFDLLLRSPLGSGGFTYRFTPEKERNIDDYPSMNLLIKKKVFLDLGGFDNDYWPGEDSKLCEDLVYKKDGTIYYHPDVLIYHHRRDNLPGFLKQHSQYGYHRGAFFAHGDKNSKRITYLIPSMLVVYLLLLPLLWPLHSLTLVPIALYSTALIVQSVVFTISSRSLIIGALSSITLFLIHLIYGIFFVKGLVVGFVKKERIY
ncbi:MAG: glycosyltransferase [bacterium]|nr:glycosyltransferase [bacterium]